MADPLTAGVVGVGVGGAAATAITPALEPLRQEAWSKSKARVLDIGTLARLVAEGLVDLPAAEAEAERSGYSADRLQRVVQLQLVAAPVAELLTMWRRGEVSQALVEHGFAKAQIEPQYWPALLALKDERLDPAVIATAIQRGIMRDPGFLPVGPPTGVGNVPAFPVSPLDTLTEAAASGIDEERLFVETAIVGLPLALVQAAEAHFRGIITLDDFKRAVAEGNTRNEWGDAALEVSRRILSPHEYAELELRGYLTAAERDAGAAKVGMTAADAQLLFDVLGRSLPVHAITTALARGGTFNGPTADIPPVYLQAIQRSNIRPEYYNLAYANRYSYPSAFVLRALTQGGEITGAQAHQILLDVGWEPTLAASVSASWSGGTTAGADKHVAKAETQLWTALHRSYVAEESTDADVAPGLTAAGVPAASQPAVLALWQEERALIRKQLSPAQVKKAVKEGVTNPATGAPWSTADALAALLARGYAQADATTLLEE